MDTNMTLHKGAQFVDEDRVRAVPCPEQDFATGWYPISHGKFLDTVREAMNDHGLVAKRTHHALNKSGTQYFAILDLETPVGCNSTRTMTLGLAHSIDKTISAKALLGRRVWICDNLSYSAELVMARKHTRYILRDLPTRARGIMTQFLAQYADEEQMIEEWERTRVTDEQAKAILVDMVKMATVKPTMLLPTLKEWQNPSQHEFQPRTLWSLWNATTAADKLRTIRPAGLATELQCRWFVFTNLVKNLNGE
jgi:hypothetical protein